MCLFSLTLNTYRGLQQAIGADEEEASEKEPVGETRLCNFHDCSYFVRFTSSFVVFQLTLLQESWRRIGCKRPGFKHCPKKSSLESQLLMLICGRRRSGLRPYKWWLLSNVLIHWTSKCPLRSAFCLLTLQYIATVEEGCKSRCSWCFWKLPPILKSACTGCCYWLWNP